MFTVVVFTDSSDCDNMSTPPKSLLNELISDFKFIYDQQV